MATEAPGRRRQILAAFCIALRLDTERKRCNRGENQMSQWPQHLSVDRA
jgi:hypothetical protein